LNFLFLYLEFFKIGLFAVGGGYATLPFLLHMAHDNFSFIRQTSWLSAEQISNFLAISQCSPGAVGVNVAAQTGYQYGGIAGGILAVLGLISPAIIVISIISKTLLALKDNAITERVFSGLRPAATALLSAAGWGVCKLSLYNPAALAAGLPWHNVFLWRECIVGVVIFLLLIKLKWHPIIYIALGATAGVLLGL